MFGRVKKTVRRNPGLFLYFIKFNVLVFLFIIIFVPRLAFAYNGSFSVMPPIAGGGNSTSSANIDIDTITTNPQSIMTGLEHVPAITVDTITPVTGNIVVREQIRDGVLSFRFTVSNDVQEVLEEAWVFFWAPDAEQLTIWHEHGGADPVPIIAQRWIPVISPPEGTVLWYFRTTSFSEFTVNIKNPRPLKDLPLVSIIILVFTSISSCVVLRRN